jgi:NAD(P)-dependent dehydrogenase (short-subunit alcohol dehydrogenase family)
MASSASPCESGAAPLYWFGVNVTARANFPARRLGTAAGVGHAAVFLVTNPYVTGTVLEVSGDELLVEWIF